MRKEWLAACSVLTVQMSSASKSQKTRQPIRYHAALSFLGNNGHSACSPTLFLDSALEISCVGSSRHVAGKQGCCPVSLAGGAHWADA